jgi:hypothetical protein
MVSPASLSVYIIPHLSLRSDKMSSFWVALKSVAGHIFGTHLCVPGCLGRLHILACPGVQMFLWNSDFMSFGYILGSDHTVALCLCFLWGGAGEAS